MTVVSGLTNTLTFVCDHCGVVATWADRDVPGLDAVWAVLTTYGWAGAASGPHECGGCARTRIQDGGRAGQRACPGTGSRTLRIEYYDDAAVLELRGDLDVRMAELLRQSVVGAGAGPSRVILDLTDAGLVDSAGLGALVRAHRALKRRGVTLCLAAPSRYLLAVLHTMRLDGVFPTFTSRAQALAQCPVRQPASLESGTWTSEP